jgi:hypothetical protein
MLARRKHAMRGFARQCGAGSSKWELGPQPAREMNAIISAMPKRKAKRPKKAKQVSKLPARANLDPSGPRLLPLADNKRRDEIHPKIDSFVDLADSAMKLWDKKEK